MKDQQCVQTCNSTTEIEVNHTMFSNKLICRAFEYYVDVTSNSTVELGTKEHPYKDISSAFVELLNLHSNKLRTITVNYLYLSQSYIIRVTNLTITTYSSSSPTSLSSTLHGTSNSSLVPTYAMPTMYKILTNMTLLLADILSESSDLSTTDITSTKSILMIAQSNLYLDNLDLTTSFESVTDFYYFFKQTDSKGMNFQLKNSNVDASGKLFYTDQQMNLNITNVLIDFYRMESGFQLDMYCNNSTQNFDSVIFVNTLTFKTTKDRENLAFAFSIFRYNGAGNVYINNVSSDINSGFDDPSIFIYLDDSCIMADDIPPKVKIENSYFTSPYALAGKLF